MNTRTTSSLARGHFNREQNFKPKERSSGHRLQVSCGLGGDGE